MKIDEQTYNDFINGDIDAFYADNWASLLSFASRILGDTNAMMAEDCVQETIVSVFKSRHNINSAIQLKSFLFTCLHNKCISLLRKTSMHDKYVKDLTIDSEKDVSACIIEQETLDLLYSAIGKLPEEYKRIFELKFEDGLKNSEAAEALGLSLSSYNKKKKKMIDLLRQSVKDDSMTLLIHILIL